MAGHLSRRDHLLRWHTQVIGNLERAIMNLKRMSELYSKWHPEHTKQLELIAAVLIQVQQTMEHFKAEKM